MANGNGDMKWILMMAALGIGGVGTNAAQFFGATKPAVAAVAIVEAESARVTREVAVVVADTMSDAQNWREEFHLCQEDLYACLRSCGAPPTQ